MLLDWLHKLLKLKKKKKDVETPDSWGTTGKKSYLSLMEQHMEESSNNHKEQVGNMPIMSDGILFPWHLDMEDRVRSISYLLSLSVLNIYDRAAFNKT